LIDGSKQLLYTLILVYMQVRNVAAAIECYRHAAEADSKDYRAWYGLGQTHELLGMFVYATYYFRRAVSACSWAISNAFWFL
jgi:anaphase-promoting complex subunit 8